jgi:hypothetical protein
VAFDVEVRVALSDIVHYVLDDESVVGLDVVSSGGAGVEVDVGRDVHVFEIIGSRGRRSLTIGLNNNWAEVLGESGKSGRSLDREGSGAGSAVRHCVGRLEEVSERF